MPPTVRMLGALAVAAVLAGLAAVCLGLVDAGHELDDVLARLEYEAGAMHRATTATVRHAAPADPITRPRAALRRAVDSLGTTGGRIVGETAPSYARWASRPLGAAIDLVPPAEPISRALDDYLDQATQAQEETARTEGAIALRGRLLDLNYDVLVQRIGEARTRTRQGMGQALTGMYVITLVSIAIAAFVVGRPGRTTPPAAAILPSRRR